MDRMSGVVAIIALLVIGWAVTLLMFTGNPFAQTEGTYRYSVSDVSVSVPLDWLHDLVKIINYQSKVQLSASYSPITVHVGNFTENLSGKNWDLFITRIADKVIAGLLSYGVVSSVQNVRVSSYSLPLGGLAILVIGLIIGFGLTFAPRIYLKVKKRKQGSP